MKGSRIEREMRKACWPEEHFKLLRAIVVGELRLSIKYGMYRWKIGRDDVTNAYQRCKTRKWVTTRQGKLILTPLGESEYLTHIQEKKDDDVLPPAGQ